MVTLHLINQPESTWMKEEKCEGQSDTSLTALGKSHSKKIAEHFKNKQISNLYTSNLHRTNQCARIIASVIPFKIKRDDRLADINLGIWQGKFPEEIESRYPEVLKAWKKDPSTAQIPNGENWNNVVSRVGEFITIFQDDELFDKNIIVVTHDIIIRIILSAIENVPSSKIWEYQLDNSSITEVQIEPDKKVISINYTDHLYVPLFK